MHDEKKWRLAVSQFHAIRTNLPGYIPEALVNEYHSVLESLAASSGEDFSSFQIPPAEVKPRVTGAQMGTRRSPGRVFYSKDNFCDSNLFERKIDSLFRYLPTVEQSFKNHVAGPDPKDYWSMSTPELEALAHRYNIGGYGDTVGHTERSIIISQLQKRDRALKPEKPAAQHNTLNVETMIGSVVQQGTTSSMATVTFNPTDAKSVVDQIRVALPVLTMTPEEKQEIDIELRTIEPQLTAPNPKKAVIAECFQSLKSIIGSATKSVVTTELVTHIDHVLKSLGL